MLLYFIITLIATTIGAMAGLGGGLIIKPTLDLLNDYPLANIGILSSFAVFTMSIVSIYKNRNSLKKMNKSLLVTLAISAFIGGLIGGKLFDLAREAFNETLVGNVQSSLLIIVLVLVITLNYFKSRINLNVKKNNVTIVISGILLGMIGAFLGIGGGPLNILLLTLIFKFSTSEAAMGSIVIIFFAQFSVIAKTTLFVGYQDYDMSMLIVMLPAAVIGGYIGSNLLQKINEKYIVVVFNITLVCVIFINLFNLFS